MHLLAAEREPVLAGEDGMASPRPSPDLLKCLVFLLSGTTLQGWQAGGSSDTHSLSLIPPPPSPQGKVEAEPVPARNHVLTLVRSQATTA